MHTLGNINKYIFVERQCHILNINSESYASSKLLNIYRFSEYIDIFR